MTDDVYGNAVTCTTQAAVNVRSTTEKTARDPEAYTPDRWTV
jgi:hypothetical protein